MRRLRSHAKARETRKELDVTKMTWIKTDKGVRFEGTDAEFDMWKKEWYDTVPKCRDFQCCHELMSCGINVGCGDCSILSTMSRGCSYICSDVTCIDCVRRSDCKYGNMTLDDIDDVKLTFIDKEV